MSIKNLSTLSLSIITVSLLSACGGGSSGNTTVIDNSPTTPVTDEDSPVLTLKGPNPQFVDVGGSLVNQGATANDTVDGDLSS